MMLSQLFNVQVHCHLCDLCWNFCSHYFVCSVYGIYLCTFCGLVTMCCPPSRQSGESSDAMETSIFTMITGTCVVWLWMCGVCH